ncbi:centromere-associated protein E isoform X1 [Gopherus evgoodei]|uniref:centromere-associated protein E isoform X1 n=1 Tax=Gopherus evgoodei TaxID=1825980 RepID=UPI0011D028B4|nr:centromere-associated protein E isoform X1 [Gopherus evgoodei]
MAEEGAVTVCVRMQPLIARENEASGDKVQLHWKSENCTVLQVDGTRAFNYDCVFHSNDSTQQVYEGVAVPIIKSAVQGYNGTIFAYGQTASGKTYTMMGSDKSTGIIPKAVQDVFKIICEIPGREFLLRVSYMEIYNETITDLLCDSRKNKPLGIREDVNRNIYVEDLIEEVVVTPEQVMEWLRKGEKKRHYGETKMNEHSSRSHTIFRMIIESRENDPANTNCDGAVMVSHLNLVDLAGSERASQTGSEGVRLKEGCNINRSLFILGQVIKKLCDDPSGFINYRDSKLTRILQNSLGGNAKTVIICTITPVSFDETLSTLQFANTAKRMRNTPKVNEVLDDDALLKRYRKEIVDLKRQLEEVSSKTHLHAMEKDQLAQLLEEKNSLQKIQENRIFNLTEMLVTSSSFTSQKDLKAKRKRRVTWAPGKINQGDISYFANFEKLKSTDAKSMKTLAEKIPEMEDSMFSEYSEYDYLCPPTPDVVSESEWNSGANMNWSQKDFADSVQLCETLALEKDIARNEVNVLQANFDNLVLENEQLKLEISELKEKLKEKIETDEFEELEKQTQKDHEMQLIHEITNLQNIVKNAEVYNEDLETELKSKLEQLKEKENEVKDLQKYVEELQKKGMGKKDMSFSMGNSDKILDEIQQMSKSLVDTETVALDAKRESAFLRSENLELKEKMNELLNGYKQMEKNVQLYQSQLEAGKVNYKKMQVDLQRELQSAFQENTKLTLLLEGKVPKDLLSLVELERKIADLKNELDKALEENTVLRKEVDTSSEFKSLPDKVEMLQKQIFEKSQELCLLTSEREKLLSEVADKEARLQGMTEEIRISKEDLASTQLKYVKADQEYLELKGHHEELEQKWLAASEESEQMKHQVELLSDEAQKLKTVVDNVKLELSNKIQELQEKTAEQEQLLGVKEELSQAQQRLSEMEQLKEKSKTNESRMEAERMEKLAIVQKLHESQEEIKILIQERDDLKQKHKTLQNETDQLKEDIQETIETNILAQEELRNAQSSIKQYQKTVEELEKDISEKRSVILNAQDTLGETVGELELKILQLTEEIKQVTLERDQLHEEKVNIKHQEESDQLPLLQEQILSLTKEKTVLLQKLESLQVEKKQCEECTSLNAEMQEELKNAYSSLKQHQETIEELKGNISEKETQLSKVQETLGKTINDLKQKVIQLSENLTLVSCEHDKLLAEKERIEQTMHECICPQLQEISSVTQERDEFQQILACVRAERDQLKMDIEENKERSVKIQAEMENLQKELKCQKEQVDAQKNVMIEREKELLKTEEKLTEETTQLKEKIEKLNEELNLVSGERNQLLSELREKTEGENKHIPQLEEQSSSLTEERDKLQHMLETVRAEKNKLEVDLHESIEKSVKIQAEIQNLHEELKKQVDTQKNLMVEREKELLKTEEKLTEETTLLKEKIKMLNEELNLVSGERNQLLSELREKTEGENERIQQLEEQNSLLTAERDKFQHILETVRAEKNKLEVDLHESVEKSVKIQAEIQNLHEELKKQVDTQKNLMVEREKELLKTEEKLTEETTLLKEKIKMLNEELNLVSGERNQLLSELREKTEGENERIQQLEEQSSSLTVERDKLQYMLETVRAEKNKLEVDLYGSIKKVNQLTEALNSVSHERHQLVTERTNHYLQLQEQISSINQEKDELQQILEGVKSERDLLKTELKKNIDMCTETNAKLKCALDELKQKNLNDVAVQANQPDDTELRHADSMKAKALEVKGLLEKFLMMEKKYECLTTASLNLKSELCSQKAVIAGILTHLSPEQAKQVKRLQTENEKISNHLQSLFNKLKFLFSRVCQKKAEYYTTINNHEMDLLDEKRKQEELLSQIRCLKKTCLKQDETASQELNFHELQQRLDLHIEHILRDMSEIETELLSIEAELQQEESARKEALQFLETCSGNHCDVEKFKDGIKQDNERLLQVIKFWTPKVKTLLQTSSEMDTRTANYCKESKIELKQRKGKTEELLEQLKTIKEQLAPCGVANLALEEENYRLCNQLKASEQDIKIMKTTIQKLENAVNEARKNVKEKEERIVMLQTEIKMKAAASELNQLQAKLNETEKCLRNALTEKQTLKAKLDKGATLYKEEIDHLKTQLVKADMERMKQSRIFEQEIATTKALAEHKEEQLRKLKEELRRAQQEQDVTVISEKDVPQESHMPLTCGGGSGIVQSTHMLILKSEQAKLQKENLQLKKNNDLLVSNELQLKEELTKWKERALKMRAESCRDTTREKIQRSPRKTTPCSVKEQMPSPSKEVSSREILPLDSPNTLPLTCPNFFDNSSLGTLTDMRPAGTECIEDRFKHWFGASEKDKAPDCTTQ